MIVVISPENDIKDEIQTLNLLFEAGLEYFHLRKPSKTHEEHVTYLNSINTEFHNRIVVHFCHELVNEFDLKGVHFQEQKRKDTIETNSGHYFRPLNMFGKTISSSYHELETLAQDDFEFDYHLLSPVFSSISKQDYDGRGFDVNHIDKVIIGMGGVTSDNINEFKKLGFKGVGVLGGIWNSSTPIETFKKMTTYFE